MAEIRPGASPPCPDLLDDGCPSDTRPSLDALLQRAASATVTPLLADGVLASHNLMLRMRVGAATVWPRCQCSWPSAPSAEQQPG
jgi:hypothetical protein